jgi:hypothetical protein
MSISGIIAGRLERGEASRKAEVAELYTKVEQLDHPLRGSNEAA